MAINTTINHGLYDNSGRNAHIAERSRPLSKEASSPKTGDSTTAPTARSAPRDVVKISPEAQANAAGSSTAQSFAVGSGYNSSGKSFDQVKQDMHALFSARNEETGVNFSSGYFLDDSIDINKVVENFGDITDRRALFAVYGDATGTFTEGEKAIAYGVMMELQQKAQGFHEPGAGEDISNRNFLNSSRGLIDFLEQASPEEKATELWVKQRAEAQVVNDVARYDINHSPADSPADSPDDVNTGDEDVNVLIKKLLKVFLEKDDWSLDELLTLSRVADLLVKEVKDPSDYARAEKGFEQRPEPDDTFTSPPEQKSAQE